MISIIYIPGNTQHISKGETTMNKADIGLVGLAA